MRIAVLFLGGTIGMTAGTDRSQGAVPWLDGAALLEGVPGADVLDLQVHDLMKKSSAHLTFDDVLTVRARAEAAVADGAGGVVVVQGTDSMEETSYALDLLWDRPEPVVVTGAMRNPSLPGPDGPGNLAAALAVAADEGARDLGVLVVLADEVHAARGVAKKHTSAPDAFLSIATGPLGRMLEGRPVLHTRVARRRAVPVPDAVTARVPLLTTVLDDDPAVVEAVGGLADGLVVAAFGAGHLRPPVADAVAALVPRIPVVLASRTGSGSVHTRTYGGPGSEVDLLGRGLVNAGHLDGLKSRLLLALLLSGGADRAGIAEAFAEHGGA